MGWRVVAMGYGHMVNGWVIYYLQTKSLLPATTRTCWLIFSRQFRSLIISSVASLFEGSVGFVLYKAGGNLLWIFVRVRDTDSVIMEVHINFITGLYGIYCKLQILFIKGPRLSTSRKFINQMKLKSELHWKANTNTQQTFNFSEGLVNYISIENFAL